jgi:uncharacterized protein
VDPTAASLTLTTSDGVSLAADLAVADDPAGCVVLCHPHPRFGGNRHNAVVAALFRALPPAGFTSLRFDFRPEAGRDDALTVERLDVVATIEELVSRSPDRPLVVAGYSFGAAVGLTVDHPAVAAKVAVAPPLTVMQVEPAMCVPTLVVLGAHDQFAPPPAVLPIVTEWPGTTTETVEMADHFFAGRVGAVTDLVVRWLSDPDGFLHLDRPPGRPI